MNVLDLTVRLKVRYLQDILIHTFLLIKEGTLVAHCKLAWEEEKWVVLCTALKGIGLAWAACSLGSKNIYLNNENVP